MSLSKRLRGLWWNQSFRRWAVMSVFLSGAYTALVSADPTDLTEIFTYQDHGLCEWRPDSTLQITDKPSYFDHESSLFLYDPQTQNLTPQGGLSNSFSFLTPTSRILPPVFIRDYQMSPGSEVFASPDGRFVVYALAISPDAYRPYTELILLDRKTWQSIEIPEMRINPYGTFIKWGAGSNAFVIIEEGGYGSGLFTTYVTGFESDLKSVKVIEISGYSETNVNAALQWEAYQIFDIDSTGQYVLADGYFHEAEDRPDQLRLIIINMQDFTYELVEADRYFITARFEQPGDNHIFYFSSGGIFAFDRSAQTRETLHDNIADLMTWERWYSRTCQPTLSPDGRFIAFDDRDNVNEVIVLPIKQP